MARGAIAVKGRHQLPQLFHKTWRIKVLTEKAKKALAERIVVAVKTSTVLMDDMKLAQAVNETTQAMRGGKLLSPAFSGALDGLIADKVLQRSTKAGGGKEVIILDDVPDSFFEQERVVAAAYEPTMTVKTDRSLIDPSLKKGGAGAIAAKAKGSKPEFVNIKLPAGMTPAPATQLTTTRANAIAAPVATAVVTGKRGRNLGQMIDDLNTAWNRRISVGQAFDLIRVTNAANTPEVSRQGLKVVYGAMNSAIADMTDSDWNANKMRGYLDWPRKAAMGEAEPEQPEEKPVPRRSQGEVIEDLCKAWAEAVDRGEPFCRSDVMLAAGYRHGDHPLMAAMDVGIGALKVLNWSPEAIAAHRDLKSVTGVSGIKALQAEIATLREKIAKLQAGQVMPSAVELLTAEVVAFDAAIAADPGNKTLKARRAAVRCAIAALKTSGGASAKS